MESARKLKEAGITEKTDKENSKGTRLDYATELADARIRAQRKVEAARIAVMVEGRENARRLPKRSIMTLLPLSTRKNAIPLPNWRNQGRRAGR